MHATVIDPRRQKWGERFQRFTFFLGIVLLHEILFLSFRNQVIWSTPRPTYLYHRAIFMRVPSPPAPKAPLPSGTTAAIPLFHPLQPGVPVVTRPILTTFHTYNVAVDTLGDSGQLLDQLLKPARQDKEPGVAKNGPSARPNTNNGGGYGQFGSGTGFVGVFYDLKQTPDGQPTDMAENEVELKSEDDCDPDWPNSKPTQNTFKLLRSFIQEWDMSILDPYFKAPGNVYATQFCVPVTTSQVGLDAFHLGNNIHPRRWAVVYHARVIPPETGEFRFIGSADDFMVVRMDGQNVLDVWGGLDPDAHVAEDVGLGLEQQALGCGKWIQMTAGIPMDMQVLLGELPGGYSGFLLMIQKRGDDSPKGDYPVFQLKEGPLPDLGPNFHFSKKTMVFGIAPETGG